MTAEHVPACAITYGHNACTCPMTAPESPRADVELTEALHRAFHEHWAPDKSLDLYPDSPLWQAQAVAVERILADRLAAVQAERDDLMALAVEDTHRRGVVEAERDDLRGRLAEADRLRALWFGENSTAQAELGTLRAERDDLRALRLAVETLAKSGLRGFDMNPTRPIAGWDDAAWMDYLRRHDDYWRSALRAVLASPPTVDNAELAHRFATQAETTKAAEDETAGLIGPDGFTRLASPSTHTQRDTETAAQALREAADRMPAFHDRDAPEWAITSACNWLRARADSLAAREGQ
jgi:hypothetical protein